MFLCVEWPPPLPPRNGISTRNFLIASMDLGVASKFTLEQECIPVECILPAHYHGRGWSLCRMGLCSGVSLSSGSLSRGVSVQGGLCPGGSLSRGVSVQGKGLCPEGASVQRGLCPGVPVQGGLSGGVCPGGLPDRDPSWMETPQTDQDSPMDRQTPVKT